MLSHAVQTAFVGGGSALTLAQSGPATSLTTLLTWVGGLIGAVVLLTVVLLAVRRKFSQADEQRVTTGSMLEQMRVMRDEGKLTEQEFQTARARLSAKVRASAGLDGPPGTNVTPELLRGKSATGRRAPVSPSLGKTSEKPIDGDAAGQPGAGSGRVRSAEQVVPRPGPSSGPPTGPASRVAKGPRDGSGGPPPPRS